MARSTGAARPSGGAFSRGDLAAHARALAGEDYDPDTFKATGHKIPHEAKIRACCGIIIDAQECGNLIDDRFEKDSTARLLSLFTA